MEHNDKPSLLERLAYLALAVWLVVASFMVIAIWTYATWWILDRKS